MTIKEQENQLVLRINLEIVITVVLWAIFWSLVSLQIWQVRSYHETPLTIAENVSTIKQENLDVLRISIRSVISSNLPVVRVEPFD
ncbi:hypothetical protein COT86_00740 [Candidatus Collierbacteria bacterium CG10_big_fil_rev_8_21_14_0_10_43_36]|uniref:Uncharacterized protein n=2 Tax=Candidatus Collieribacteriota TaxID=1752725 RepID=A0A2H0DT65_9BACT|nr:hypothetical protein [bacterium]NCQ56039.1 hypothetical protein [Candidatus Parcubacteria bacterium]PIP85363.1 MAG: hypothetical protein COW83_04790 [Candidatus Collierbacteria bacterium CG22_combo_CG10-13_8_21_14_all_43_12]PIS00060.1 MAG: hypothetical protein COT86_00740 [Candidatus Collierbacteria bacterium CG10_big_fil_rev_8_21_14_0_10_43_36]